MPKRTVKSVKASCDRTWAALVRARAGNVCERCGRPARESHHAYGRMDHRLRFDVRNGVSCCFKCHVHFESHPVDFTNWLRGDRTEDAAYLALEHAKGPLRRTLSDYLELEASLQEQLGKWTEELAA